MNKIEHRTTLWDFGGGLIYIVWCFVFAAAFLWWTDKPITGDRLGELYLYQCAWGALVNYARCNRIAKAMNKREENE